MNRIILSIAILGIIIQIATAIPPLPSEFYGNVQIDGNPAPEGLLIVAKLGDKECGNITVKKQGIYGGESTFDQRLIVSCGDVPVTGAISFWANGNCADKAALVMAGSSQNVDLNIRTGNKVPVLTVTPGENEKNIQKPVTTKKATITILPIIGSVLIILFIFRKKGY